MKIQKNLNYQILTLLLRMLKKQTTLLILPHQKAVLLK